METKVQTAIRAVTDRLASAGEDPPPNQPGSKPTGFAGRPERCFCGGFGGSGRLEVDGGYVFERYCVCAQGEAARAYDASRLALVDQVRDLAFFRCGIEAGLRSMFQQGGWQSSNPYFNRAGQPPSPLSAQINAMIGGGAAGTGLAEGLLPEEERRRLSQ